MAIFSFKLLLIVQTSSRQPWYGGHLIHLAGAFPKRAGGTASDGNPSRAGRVETGPARSKGGRTGAPPASGGSWLQVQGYFDA